MDADGNQFSRQSLVDHKKDIEPERIIFHLDMDAFFAAIEQRDHPEYRGQPVVVGSPPDKRGVVSAASYEARRYGIHSAMPSRTAYQRCPAAIFLPVRGEHYQAVSRVIMTVMREFTPLVEKVSIDEAFMDLSGRQLQYSESGRTAERLKVRIQQRTGLTASVGIAPNKFLAKLARDMNKPDGLTIVPSAREDIRRFLIPLPVNKLWGVGKTTDEKLKKLRIRTIGDLQQYPENALRHFLGNHLGGHLFQLARGHDDRPVVTEREEKSISSEHTFPEDVSDMAAVRRKLLELTQKVGYRLRKSGKTAATGCLKIRYQDFSTITRQQRLSAPTDSDRVLINCALSLFEKEPTRGPIRLIGFGAGNFHDRATVSRQPFLFPEANPEMQDQALDNAIDELRGRYGEQIIKRGI